MALVFVGSHVGYSWDPMLGKGFYQKLFNHNMHRKKQHPNDMSNGYVGHEWTIGGFIKTGMKMP